MSIEIKMLKLQVREQDNELKEIRNMFRKQLNKFEQDIFEKDTEEMLKEERIQIKNNEIKLLKK